MSRKNYACFTSVSQNMSKQPYIILYIISYNIYIYNSHIIYNLHLQMPHVIYIHIPYIILHLDVHIQYHIQVFVFARRRKAARIAKAAGFVLYVHCPLNP